MIKLHTQQGDCLMEVVSKVPANAKRIKVSDKFVILKGEGVNEHTIEEVNKIEAYEVDGTIYLKVNETVDIVHEEHGRTTLVPNKIYKRVIEREFDYESMEARQTMD